MPEIAIQTHKLCKDYHGVQALKDLDLEVPAHAIVGFLGPNGAGKSTTIKLLLGLNHPTSGSGTIFNNDIVRHSQAIRQRVGYLAQQPRFDTTMTARQTLRFVAAFFYKGGNDAIEQRVNDSLALVGLSEKADRPIRGFSGGEIQRLGIAQAQINEPDLLILDEPAAALDPMGRHDVLNIMENLRERTTIFYSTHILDDVQRVSDHVVILNHGELVTQGSIDSLLNAEDSTSYHIVIRGDVNGTKDAVSRQPWVNHVHVARANGEVQLQVSVNSTQIADDRLLRMLLANEQVQVLEYGRNNVDLEDVFMQIVQ